MSQLDRYNPYPILSELPTHAQQGKRTIARRETVTDAGWHVVEEVEILSNNGSITPYQGQAQPVPYQPQLHQPSVSQPERLADQPAFTFKHLLLVLAGTLLLCFVVNVLGQLDRTKARFEGYQEGVQSIR